MKKIATYRDIVIMWSYGYYFPLIDLSVERENFSDVVRWIDAFFKLHPPVSIVDDYIIGEYVILSKYHSN